MFWFMIFLLKHFFGILIETRAVKCIYVSILNEMYTFEAK